MTAIDPWREAPPDPRAGGPLSTTQPPANPINPLRARLLNRGDLATLPEPSPFISDTIDANTVVTVGGAYGTLKSFTVQSWGACVATGRPWLGRPVVQRRTLYIAAEGAPGLDDRLKAWEYAWGVDIPADALWTLPDAVNLSNAVAVKQLAALVSDEGIGFVVVDTLAKCAVGLDENSSRDMGLVVDSLYRLKDATAGGVVAIVHHTGKDKTTIRGSSALEAGVDTVYLAEGDSKLVKLTRTKRKDGPCDDVLRVRLETDKSMKSGFLVSTRDVDMTGSEDTLMSAFMSTFSATGATKAELRDAAGMPSGSFHRALNRLISKGFLVNQGTDARPFYRRTP